MLIIKKESAYQKWYREHKQQLSQQRKQRYAEDAEYRKQRLEASRRYRRGERTLPVPADAPISLAQAAERIDIGTSTLREWRRKEVFKQKLVPEAKYYKGRVWFTEKQVELLKPLKEFFRKYKMRPPKITQPILAELRASIFA